MNEIQIYWGDMVVHLLQAGTALFVLFAGWRLSTSSKFNIRGNKEDEWAIEFELSLEDIKKILSWSVGDKAREVVGKDEVQKKEHMRKK